jgi:integrase
LRVLAVACARFNLIPVNSDGSNDGNKSLTAESLPPHGPFRFQSPETAAMARNLLTDADVRTSTCPEGKRVAKLFDGEGLELWVSPVKRKAGRPKNGAASVQFVRRWRFSYRVAGKRNSLSVGTYPTVSLAVAREKAEELRRQMAAGHDPAARRKADKRALEHAAANTFSAIADEWLAKQRMLDGKHARAEVSLAKLTWLIDIVRPDIGALLVGEITPMQCLAALKKIEARGKFDTARRCRSTLSRVFKMAVATGRAAFDPTSALIGNDVLTPPAGKNRPAVTDPILFGCLLRDIEAYHGAPETRLALKLLALTAMRPGELRQLRWSWIGENAGQPAICVPAPVMKMRKEHRVPLSRQAVGVVEELRALTGWTATEDRIKADADFVFPCSQPRRTVGREGKPSKRPFARPMSENALGSALKRLGYKAEQHVPHGFRSSFSTISNEAGVSEPHVVEAALAHVTPGIAGDYNRATYWPRRVIHAQWWADRCDEMREERPARVVALRPVVA